MDRRPLPDGPAEEIAAAIATLRQATSTPDLRRCLASLGAAAERQGRIARELELDARALSAAHAGVGSSGEAIRCPAHAPTGLPAGWARRAEFHRALQDRFNAVAVSLGSRVLRAIAIVDAVAFREAA